MLKTNKNVWLKVEHRGYDVNHRDPENVTLLHWASINNRIEIVKYLIVKGLQGQYYYYCCSQEK